MATVPPSLSTKQQQQQQQQATTNNKTSNKTIQHTLSSTRGQNRPRQDKMDDSSQYQEAATATSTLTSDHYYDASIATTYEHVYCGGEEGQLTISPMGIFFNPYVPANVPTGVWLPNHIQYGDIQKKEFRTSTVAASSSSYATEVTLYEYKLEVYPSKEILFQFRDANEWERLQCDLDARGQGAAMVSIPAAGMTEAEEAAATGVAPGFHQDDYDGMMTPEEQAAAAATVNEDPDWEEEKVEDDVEWQHEDERFEDEGDARPWSAADAWNAPDTTYYPVQSRGEVGTLKLNGTCLQFVPDRHSAPVQRLPWTSFAGRPFFSPYNYPIAAMHVHYHTTVGPHKKAGFDLGINRHDELKRLENDVHDRMRPFHSIPREKVYIPPKQHKQPMVHEGEKAVKKKKAAPPVFRDDTTEASTSFTDSDNAPLVVTPYMRRRRHHKEEKPRKMWFLFISYCFVITFTGLTLSILFGYFFGPRRERGQPVRTQPPGDISQYLGTNPPTAAPTPRPTNFPTSTPRDSFSGVGSQAFKRDVDPADTSTGTEASGTSNATLPDGIGGDGLRPDDASEPNRGVDIGDNEEPVTVAPSAGATRSVKSILDLLIDNSPDGGELIRSTGTPQQAAYLLLKTSGVLDEAPSDALIEQKYTLATLYYSTGGEQWNEGATEWMDLDKNDCLKTHVVCDGGAEKAGADQKAEELNMNGNGLVGSIPGELSMMSGLRVIDLGNNGLVGSIPTTLGLLTELESLDLTGNPGLTGTVPPEVLSLPLLTDLKVDLQ